MVPGGIVTVSISAGLALVVALIGRLRRPKALRLEDKRTEIDSLHSAITGMDQALTGLRGDYTGLREEYDRKLKDCEKRHDECKNELEEMNRRIDKLFEGPIPPYTNFRRMGNESKLQEKPEPDSEV